MVAINRFQMKIVLLFFGNSKVEYTDSAGCYEEAYLYLMIIKKSKYKTEDDILWREARLLHKQFLAAKKRWGVGTAIVRELENIKLRAIEVFYKYGLYEFNCFDSLHGLHKLHDFLLSGSYESKALTLYQQYPEFFRNFYPAISDIFMDLSIVATDAEDKTHYGLSAISFINLAYLFYTHNYCYSYDSAFYEAFNLAVRRAELLYCFVSRVISESDLNEENSHLFGRLRGSAYDCLIHYANQDERLHAFDENASKTFKNACDMLDSVVHMLK